ncbi:MAG: DUF815 domain-containing protein [Candidatus Woesearchaeota archaeon]|jgi:predicted AAA+ superfamily ATPase|nr:DUF815 domain-containing protein [Candidatus Woesearchaeota archaeon]
MPGQSESVTEAANQLVKDAGEFYYKTIHPIALICRLNNFSVESKRQITRGDSLTNILAQAILYLEQDYLLLKEWTLGLSQDPGNVPAKLALEHIALTTSGPFNLRHHRRAQVDSYESSLDFVDADIPDSATFFTQSMQSKEPNQVDYAQFPLESFLIHQALSSLQVRDERHLNVAELFRTIDLGEIFQNWQTLLAKHLDKGSVLGKHIGYLQKAGTREIPLLGDYFSKQSHRWHPKQRDLAKHMKKNRWDKPSIHADLTARFTAYDHSCDPLEVYHTLKPGHYMALEHYALPSTRMSEIRGYSGVKREMKEICQRHCVGLPIGHTVLYGPPGTGKSSLVKALANIYKGIKWVFVAGNFENPHSEKDMERLLNDLQWHDHQFMLAVDDTDYEKSSAKRVWEAVQPILESITSITPNVRLLLSTNNWEEFPPSFHDRIQNHIEMALPYRRTQRSIASFYLNQYGLSESVPDILGAIHASAPDKPISGRAIELHCKGLTTYGVEHSPATTEPSPSLQLKEEIF